MKESFFRSVLPVPSAPGKYKGKGTDDVRVFQKEYVIGDEGLSAGALQRIFQDISSLHVDQIGMGGKDIGLQGLIWVVTRQTVQIERMPRPGEKILACTWPGFTRHMLFPRYYSVLDETGSERIRGCALWAMVDMATRKMVNPKDYGLSLEGIVTGGECRLPAAAGKLPVEHGMEFTVMEEYLDSNMHMNNTRYYDLAESCIGGETEGLRLCSAATEFVSEARCGDRIHVEWGREENRFFIKGESGGPVFKMSLEYK